MTKALDKLSWHDGQLLDISFSINGKGKSSVVLAALFYLNEQAPKREKYTIECSGVSRFSTSLDAVELKSNMSAGNISNGYLKDKVLWLYFTDGLVEIHAQKFRLSKC